MSPDQCSNLVSLLNLEGKLMSGDPTSRDLQTRKASLLNLAEKWTLCDLCTNSVSLINLAEKFIDGESVTKIITAGAVSGAPPAFATM